MDQTCELSDEEILENDSHTTTNTLHSLSTVPLTSIFKINDNLILSIIDCNKSLYFHGVVDVQLIYGSVNVYGYNFKVGSNTTLYSPFCSTTLSIEGSNLDKDAVNNNINNIFDVINAYNFKDENEKQSIIDILQTKNDSIKFDISKSSILLIYNTPKDKVFHYNLYIKKTEEDQNEDSIYMEAFYPIFQPKYPVKPLIIPSHWYHFINDKILSYTNSSNDKSIEVPTILTCGTKDIGKSTFNRVVVNRLLSKYKYILYLEADVGQSEFAPNGLITLNMISEPLCGPPFSHQKKPIRSYFFGDTSPKNNTEYYLDLIKSMVDYAKTLQQSFNIPIVFNTLGWLKGVGYYLLLEIIKYFNPSHLVFLYYSKINNNNNMEQKQPFSIFSQDDINALYEENETANITTLYTIETVQVDGNVLLPMSNSSIRQLSLTNYFGDQNIQSMSPYALKFNQVKISIINNEVPFSQTMYALNSSLIGICSDNGLIFKDVNYSINSEYPTFLSQKDNEIPIVQCLGLGLVRSIDVENKLMYILTPISQDELEHCSLILKGSISISPEVSLTVSSKGSILTPYLKLELVKSSGSGIMERQIKKKKIIKK